MLSRSTVRAEVETRAHFANRAFSTVLPTLLLCLAPACGSCGGDDLTSWPSDDVGDAEALDGGPSGIHDAADARPREDANALLDAASVPDAETPLDAAPDADAGPFLDATTADVATLPDANVDLDAGLSPDAASVPDASGIPDATTQSDAEPALDGGVAADIGPTPATPPRATVFPTSGSGTTRADGLKLRVYVGVPEFTHVLSDGSHRLRLGPSIRPGGR